MFQVILKVIKLGSCLSEMSKEFQYTGLRKEGGGG